MTSFSNKSTDYRLVLHTIPLMLNVKQGSCEYQLFSLGLTRRGDRTHVYRLGGERC